MAKVQLQTTCSCCGRLDQKETELDLIFDAIIKKKPATKGPIDSIKALLKNEKPILKRY
ncbi:MAG: hypothetical protein IIA82_09635 [Thaumarchaeota archaeon]|nr:hypothetical protein [Nitrososphaerota archaeon]